VILTHTDELTDIDLARECSRCGRTILGDAACKCRRELRGHDIVLCMHGRAFGWYGCPRCGRHMMLGTGFYP
jgi:hypothetical protein